MKLNTYKYQTDHAECFDCTWEHNGNGSRQAARSHAKIEGHLVQSLKSDSVRYIPVQQVKNHGPRNS